MHYTSIIFCASAFLVQVIAGQSISSNCECQSIKLSSSGGQFIVSSTGPIGPTGIVVTTDLSLGGELDVAGEVPYLAAVAFEGQFDTSGSAPVSYGCGDGCIAITQEFGNPSANNVALSSGLNGGNINSCGRPS